jgi:hypothetical protein
VRLLQPKCNRVNARSLRGRVNAAAGDTERYFLPRFSRSASVAGKGSHRNYVHPALARPITISGKPGDDAEQYQIRAVRLALEELKK